MTRVIKARALVEGTKSQVGHLASHDGAATPRYLAGAYPLNGRVVLVWRGEFGEHMYRTDTAVEPDADITIHD